MPSKNGKCHACNATCENHECSVDLASCKQIRAMTRSAGMFLRPNHRSKTARATPTVAGRDDSHGRWAAPETLCYLGELNSSAHTRWLRTLEVFNEQGEAQQLKLFPSHVKVPPTIRRWRGLC